MNNGEANARGHIHPISSLIREAGQIFTTLGFTVEDGPILETQWNNFDALNVPRDHPARDMQDTFFIKDDAELVLRTHTTSVHIHYIQEQLERNMQPPYRAVAMGKVLR